jgi:hypothetical protein
MILLLGPKFVDGAKIEFIKSSFMQEAMDRSLSHKQQEKFVHYEDTLPVKVAFLVTLCAACVCTAYVVILTNQTTETMGTYEALFPAMRGQLLRNIDTGIAERGPFSL